MEQPVQSGTGSAGIGGGSKKSFNVVDLKQYFFIVVKRIWLVALCFIVSLSVMVVILIRQIPEYQSVATLLLSRGLPLPVRLKQEEMELILGDYIATQQRIIQSSLVINGARERLNLPGDEFNQKYRSLSVVPIWQTAIMAITVKGLDPVFCADFANALAEEYLDFKAGERMDTSQATVISLTQQANRLHEELKKAEIQSLAFIRENSVVGIQERGNVAAEFLGSLSRQAATYRNQRMLLEAQQPLLSQASDEVVLATLSYPIQIGTIPVPNSSMSTSSVNSVLGGGPESLIEYGVVEQPFWSALKRKKAVLEGQLVSYRKKYKEEHPLVKETVSALQETDDALNVELEFALRQFYSQLESLSIREKSAERVEKEWEDQALEVSKKMQEYRNIQRNSDRLQGLYDLVFNRLKEVDITLGIEPESVRIMERAKPPSSPITPRKLQSLFMAALVGLGIGLGLIFGLEYIDDSIRYPEEVTQGLGIPFLGVVPSANWDPEDLRAHILANIDQKSGLAEAYRNVRSSLLLGKAKDRLKTLVITSAVPKEGKTTTCLNLAISLAQAGSRVLMVDADMRRGELHKFFGLEGGRGLADVLTGQAKPEAVIQRSGVPNLDLIATGPFPSNPAEIVLRPEMNSFLDYARRTYDKVVFDCPPVMAVSEAAILASMVDGVITIVWAGHTSKKLAQLCARLIRERGAVILGCVLNNLEFSRVGYYYYSTYYGYYNYDYHYGKNEAGKRV